MRIAFALLGALVGAGCHSASSSVASCSITAPQLPDARLRIDGTKLRDGLGRQVFLRGVNAGGRSKFAPFLPFDFPPGDDAAFRAALGAYLDRAASFGIDALRVPFTWAAVEPTQGHYDEQFLSRYDALLDGAWARGMRTIVDFHQDVYAENFCGDGFPAWTLPPMPPAPHHDCVHWFNNYNDPQVIAAFDRFWGQGSPIRADYGTLWDRMAARYKDKPGVIGFELFNEPSGGSLDSAAFESGVLSDFYDEMGRRLRAAAPSSLLFFDGMGIDSALGRTGLRKPAGEGWVFAPHYYQPTTILPGGEGNPDTVRGDIDRWAAYQATFGVPVWVGEFGAPQIEANADYLRAVFDALDADGIGGTAWEYSLAREAWNLEPLGLSAADGSDEPTTVALRRPTARAVAGDEVAIGADRASGAWTLGFVASGGITEVALPTSATAPDLALTGAGACVDASQAGRLLVQAPTGSAVMLRVTLHR